MACGCDNNGWGGCGCGNTVQYAPSVCNSNFPTTCTALGQGVIQRVVGEDSGSCKYTIPTFNSNSLLSYNASTGLVNWADGSASNPIFLGSGNQVSSSTVGAIQGTTPTGQLVEFNPSTSAETQFPIVSPSGVTTTWGTIENIIPSQGIVYKNASNVVVQAPLGTAGQVLTMVGGVPQFGNISSSQYIDAQSISTDYATSTSLTVNYGSLVLNSLSTGVAPIVKNGSGTPFTLNTNTTGIGNMDASYNTAGYYYVYAIYNPTTSTLNVIGSSSYTLPSTTYLDGYTYYRLIGMFYMTSSNVVASGFFQNGRYVYLGQSNYIPVVTTSTVSVQYLGGPITFAPYQVVSSAVFSIYNAGPSASGAVVNAVIASTQAYGTAGTPITHTANHGVSLSSEFYGSGAFCGIGMVNTALYSDFSCAIPIASSAYYNVNLPGYAVASTLYIKAYTLSIF